jgi:hypothetical protein
MQQSAREHRLLGQTSVSLLPKPKVSAPITGNTRALIEKLEMGHCHILMPIPHAG